MSMHYAFFGTSTNLSSPPRANGTCIRYIRGPRIIKLRVNIHDLVGISLKIRIFLSVQLCSSDRLQDVRPRYELTLVGSLRRYPGHGLDLNNHHLISAQNRYQSLRFLN